MPEDDPFFFIDNVGVNEFIGRCHWDYFLVPHGIFLWLHKKPHFAPYHHTAHLHTSSYSVFSLLTNSKEKKSVFTFRIQNILSKALQLQGHKGRCVQFATCVKYFIFNASCESHRPAFMTLEPIRWRCKFAETLRNDKYFEVQQQHKA